MVPDYKRMNRKVSWKSSVVSLWFTNIFSAERQRKTALKEKWKRGEKYKKTRWKKRKVCVDCEAVKRRKITILVLYTSTGKEGEEL